MPEQCRCVSVIGGACLTASIEAIRKSGGRLNEWGIKEMLDYLRRIGYKVC